MLLAAVGGPYRYTVTAMDPDGDPLEFRLLQGPTGMTLDPDTGLPTGAIYRIGVVPEPSAFLYRGLLQCVGWLLRTAQAEVVPALLDCAPGVRAS